MTTRLGLVGFVAGALILAAGCRGGSGDGDDSPRAPWDFPNAVDAVEFESRLPGLAELTRAAGRARLPAAETRDAAPPASALALVGLDAAAPADCTDEPAVFGLRGSGPASSGALNLSDGQSCGDAVRTIKSFYAQALDAAGLTSGRIATMKPGGVACGYSTLQETADPKVAAVAYRLTPLDAPAGLTYEQTLYGAADRTRVGYLSVVHARCDKSVGDCGGGAELAIDTQSEVIANPEAGTLDLDNILVLTSGSPDPRGGIRETTTAVTSTLAVTGLAAGAALKATETTTYSAVTPADGAVAGQVALSMTLEELSEGRLRLVGNVTSNVEGATPRNFTFELRRQGDLCRVGLGTEPKVAEPFDPATLPGTWSAPCASLDLGRLGERFVTERVTFGEDGALRHELTAFDDQECFTGHEAARVTVTGSYVLGGELPTRAADGAVQVALDRAHRDVEILLIDPELVTRFNDARLCDRMDWAVGIPRRFDAGRCYFDLGAGGLMSAATLRRKNEYLAFKPSPPRVLEMPRSVELSGAHPDHRAALTGSGGVRLEKVD